MRTIQQIVKRLGRAANGLADAELVPDAHAHPHALRHGFALRYLADGGSVARLRQLLGHRNIATTAQYLAARDADRDRDLRDLWQR